MKGPVTSPPFRGPGPLFPENGAKVLFLRTKGGGQGVPLCAHRLWMAFSWLLSAQTPPHNRSGQAQKQKHLSYFFNLFVLGFSPPPIHSLNFTVSICPQRDKRNSMKHIFIVGLAGDWNSLNRNPNSKTLAWRTWEDM